MMGFRSGLLRRPSLLGVFVFSRLFLNREILLHVHFPNPGSWIPFCRWFSYFPQSYMVTRIFCVFAIFYHMSNSGAFKTSFGVSSPSEFMCGQVKIELPLRCIQFHSVSSLLSCDYQPIRSVWVPRRGCNLVICFLSLLKIPDHGQFGFFFYCPSGEGIHAFTWIALSPCQGQPVW